MKNNAAQPMRWTVGHITHNCAACTVLAGTCSIPDKFWVLLLITPSNAYSAIVYEIHPLHDVHLSERKTSEGQRKTST